MVFGFFSSFVGMKVVGWLIGAIFITYVGSATATC